MRARAEKQSWGYLSSSSTGSVSFTGSHSVSNYFFCTSSSVVSLCVNDFLVLSGNPKL